MPKNWPHSTGMPDSIPSVRPEITTTRTWKPKRKGRPLRAHQVWVSGDDGESEQQLEADDIADIMRIHAVSPSAPLSYRVSMEINKIPITVELDTGVSVSLVSEATWADKLNKPSLQPCTLSLQSYPNRSLKVLGQCQCI